MKKIQIVKNIMFVVLVLIAYYFVLPPINISSPAFWSFFYISLIGYLVLTLGLKFIENVSNVISGQKSLRAMFNIVNSIQKMIIIFIGVSFLLIMLVNTFLTPLFSSRVYAGRINVDSDAKFVDDITNVDPSKLPVIDKDSTMRLGDRVMGRMPDLVSQFDVSNVYTQINYDGKIVRVTPLEYSSFFKMLSNRKDGISGYIMVDSVTGEADLIRLPKGIKYAESAILNENIDRKLRFSHPTKIFSTKSFEIDDEGNPYWIVPTLKYSGVGVIADISGVVIFDPISGESNYYDVKDVPTWVDHVYPSDLVIEQLDNWGTYRGGFLNSIFSQKNVVVTSDGYNYTLLNDDVYLYTGLTSVIADESNIGFVMTNLRTKETKFYEVPGAQEYSAMDSAEGQVQQMNYRSTFPLLVNVNNKPTYFVSLKDAAGLVKMYAFVDVADYQKVVVTDASLEIEAAIANYIGNDINASDKLQTKTITITTVKTAIIKGNTHYFIKDSSGIIYRANISVNEALLPFLTSDEKVVIEYKEKTTNEVVSIKKAN